MLIQVGTGTVHTTQLEVHMVQLICCLLNMAHSTTSGCTLDTGQHVTCDLLEAGGGVALLVQVYVIV